LKGQKELPPPLRRVIGDMSDTAKVLLGLDILPYSAKLNQINYSTRLYQDTDLESEYPTTHSPWENPGAQQNTR
jgi:hypothetical protein